jgi:putative colanic acid biosynthesis UDP-glucose lipid carrier transferase
MIVHRMRGLVRLLTMAQAALVTALFWGLYLSYSLAVAPGTEIFLKHYLIFWALVLGGLAAEVLTRRRDRVIAAIYESSLIPQLPLASRQVFFALGGILVFMALSKDYAISRLFLITFAVSLYFLFVLSNATLPLYLARRLFAQQRDLGTVLVGPANRVGSLEFWLERKREFGLRIVGVVTYDLVIMPPENCAVPVLGAVTQFEQICARWGVTQAVMLELGDPRITRALLAKCQKAGIRLLIVNDLAERLRHPITCFVDEGVNLITIHEEPLENPWNRVLKRTFDIVVSAAVVVFILPWLMIVVWICQRFQSPGPLWHRQQRAGLQNRPFEIVKFRTMHPAPPGGEAVQATAGDARIYPAGRWLRRFSLDEFPQFLNVLTGRMSIVGPRPHLVEHNSRFAAFIEEYHIRTFIKPGITGLAQVRGFRGEARTPEDIAARLQSDLIYLENWSLALDCGIVVRTIWQLVRPPATAV